MLYNILLWIVSIYSAGVFADFIYNFIITKDNLDKTVDICSSREDFSGYSANDLYIIALLGCFVWPYSFYLRLRYYMRGE